MLLELSIRDLALIEQVELRFGPGLNAITGETGAGKSLLVGALELLLGERLRGAPGDWVRQGAERALVDGRFALEPGPLARRVRAWLQAELPELLEDVSSGTPPSQEAELELILGRALGRDGRTRAHVNQRPVTQKALRVLAGLLVEIHGQNDHQKLLERSEQLALLDACGGHANLLEGYRAVRARWREVVLRLERVEQERGERAQRLDYLRFQSAELHAARVEPAEAAKLREERAVLRGAGELRGELARIQDELSEGEGAASERVQRASRVLDRWKESIASLAPPSESLQSALVHLDEAVRALSSFGEGVQDDPRRLEVVEERLAEIERLEHKYQAPADELETLRARLESEMADVERAEQGSSELATQVAGARAELARAADALGLARAKLAPKLVGAVKLALGELGLERANFAIELRARGEPRVEQRDQPRGSEHERPDDAEHDQPGDPENADLARFGEDGADELEFMLSANPGEALRPLRHVASGGEAARIMLALRTALSAGDSGRTLIFDEIDAGVGGRLGPKVGLHLRQLGKKHQVLCVTHLPAIAAGADVHVRVAKNVRGERTVTQAVELSDEAREREVADMIAGGRDQATARAEARRLLQTMRG